jgi:hypothetical protein
MLAGALFVTAGTAHASVLPASDAQAAQSVSAVAPQASALTEMTPTGWRTLGAGLDSVAATPFAAMTPSFSGAGCGFVGVCVDLDRTDQGALTNGGAAALGVAICFIPAVGQVACVLVGAALAVAATYVSTNGICPNKLRVTIVAVPFTDSGPRCV